MNLFAEVSPQTMRPRTWTVHTDASALWELAWQISVMSDEICRNLLQALHKLSDKGMVEWAAFAATLAQRLTRTLAAGLISPAHQLWNLAVDRILIKAVDADTQVPAPTLTATPLEPHRCTRHRAEARSCCSHCKLPEPHTAIGTVQRCNPVAIAQRSCQLLAAGARRGTATAAGSRAAAVRGPGGHLPAEHAAQLQEEPQVRPSSPALLPALYPPRCSF